MVKGNGNKKIFQDDMDKEKILLSFKKYSQDNILRLIAYCVLDTHAHFLIKVEEQDISTIMKKINVSYAYYYNSKYKSKGHVFYDRFQSACISDTKYLLAVLRYIHNNPRRCKFREKEILSYKWNSYIEYTQDTLQSYLTDTDMLLEFGKTYEEAIQNFIKYANSENCDIFLDVEESIEHKINMIIERYLYKNNIKLEELGYKQNKIHRINLVLMMKDTGKLSIRKIGEQLHLNRGIVYNIIKSINN